MERDRVAIIFVMTAALFSATAIAAAYSVQNALASEFQPCLQTRLFRIENEQYSSQNITVGESIKITGELQSLVNKQIMIKPIVPTVDKDEVSKYSQDCEPLTLSDATKIAATTSEWQLVNTSFTTGNEGSFTLDGGENLPFSIEIKSIQPGVYRLATGFVFPDAPEPYYIVNLARGASIQVMPTERQLQQCQELDIIIEKCNDLAILQKTPSQIPMSEEGGKSIKNEQRQIGNSMYLIGIGAAIAGIVAFITLRKRK